MINDPLEAVYYPRRKTWHIKQGNETFYDEDNIWIEFETEEEAKEWIKEYEKERET